MPVRVLMPRHADESEERYQRQVEAHEKAVEQDAEDLRRVRKAVDAATSPPKRVRRR